MILGPLQLDRPQWLLLAPVLWLVAWWMARRSLGGLGGRTRIVALAVRMAVIFLILFALAEPRWRKVSEDLAVLVVLDTSASMPPDTLEKTRGWIEKAVESARPDDRLGLVSAAEDSLVQALPSRLVRTLRVESPSGPEGTNLAPGVRLAMAVLPEDAAGLILLTTDGNETEGSLLEVAQAAKAAGVRIDVLPVTYTHERELMLERLIAPQSARRGEPVNVRFVLRSTAPTRARLTLLAGDEPIDIDPTTPGFSAEIDVPAGVSVQTVPITLTSQGAKRFRAVVEPLEPGFDVVAENNIATAVTFVAGEGRVLFYVTDIEAAEPLLRAMREAKIDAVIRPATEPIGGLVDLGEFDAIVMNDVSAYSMSGQQQKELKSYVHDLGGGLLVVGGPNSFGAGGWIGSELADALPVKMDPPQKKHMPKGALVLVMHSCEAPNGNYWGQQTALAAAEALSRLDLIGVVELNWQAGGPHWVYPLSHVNDRVGVRAAINNLSFGDLKQFEPILSQVCQALVQADAGQRHAIIISDGDPSGPSQGLIDKFIEAKITVSCVAVFPHDMGFGGAGPDNMADLARQTGGQFYLINTQAGLPQLPQIFIKEAQTVKRSLIWEGDPFQPAIADAGAEAMRGIASVPPVRGYIVTAEREGLALVTMRGRDNDPMMAQWQFGLGRVVAFMSDGAARWSPSWIPWEGFRSFWEQHVRWVMRPTGSANVRVVTETRGDTTSVIVEATQPDGSPLNFARFQGRAVGPDLSSSAVELRQTGAGRYEGAFESKAAGAYVLSLRYDAPTPGGGVERGGAQAAVTRPFADERRALRDNSALLRQVAEITGGRVLDPDPAGAPGLFDRAGLRMPVATTSIWLATACAAIGLFLVDVAVRRVRIDLRAMARTVRSAFSSRRKAGGTQVGAMRAARERAKGEIARRSTEEPGSSGATARRKFEADPTVRAAPAVDVAKPGEPRTPPPAARKDDKDTQKKNEDEEGMSRLMRAKRRARDTMKDDESNPT